MSGRLHPNRRLVTMKPRSAFWLSLIRVFALVVPLSLILSYVSHSGLGEFLVRGRFQPSLVT